MKIKKLSEDAQVPTYATSGSACFDIRSIDEGYVDDIGHVSEIFRTGLAFEIPKGHVMLVFSRSGHGFKNDVRLANAVGVIDEDYRGELMVKLTADPNGLLAVQKGDRIAQAMVLPVEQVYFEVVEELSETKRSTGGFGSTGR